MTTPDKDLRQLFYVPRPHRQPVVPAFIPVELGVLSIT